MRFEPVSMDAKSLNIDRHRHGKIMALIEEFLASENDVVELKWEAPEYVNVESATSTVAKSIRRGRYNCKVVRRGTHIYLMRGVD